VSATSISEGNSAPMGFAAGVTALRLNAFSMKAISYWR